METYKDHITMSPDLNAERLETLRQLFPDWFTQEGHLDVNEVKKAVNPDSVDETERYEFRWLFVQHERTLTGESPPTALIVGRLQPKARVSAARRNLKEASGKHLV